MIDLTTKYLGLTLKCPLVASASPLCEQVQNLRRMEDNGIGAVVLPSLFEEQLRLESGALDSDLHRGSESFGEALSYFPEMQDYRLGPDAYLELVRNAKSAVSIPVIASLNGTSRGGWIDYARQIEKAGADALELNLYNLVTDATQTSAHVEQDHYDLVREVKNNVKIPLAVKLSVFFTAPANLAKHLDEAGADALVLFNRFYQADFDIEQLEVVPRLTLSQPYELLLRLRWVAIIYGHVKADLAVTGGVHRAEDVLKSMMAGAKVAMMTSALLEHGIGHVAHVMSDLRRWMEEHEYASIEQMQGSLSHRNAPNPAAIERMNYIRVLSSYTLNPARPNL